jgi:hypothetical protein
MVVRYDSAFIGTSISLASFKEEFGLTLRDKTAKEFASISANIVSTYRECDLLYLASDLGVRLRSY